MYFSFKKSAIALIVATLCASCNDLPELEEKREKILQKLAQCPVEEKQYANDNNEPNDCQRMLTEQLTRIENGIYKEKYGANYSDLFPYLNGYWVAYKGHNIGFLDPNGKEVVAPKYTDRAKLLTSIDGPWPDFLLGVDGINADKDRYKNAFPVVYLQDNEGNWGGVNIETGEEAIPFKYNALEIEAPYLILKEKGNNHKTLVNKQGKIAIDTAGYDEYEVLYQGAILATREGKSFLVFGQKELSEFNKDDYFSVKDNFITVETFKPKKFKLFTLDGKLLYENNSEHPYFKEFKKEANIIALESYSDGYLIFDKSGKKLFEGLNDIKELNDKYLTLKKDGKAALIDFAGNIVFDFKYNDLKSLRRETNFILFEDNDKEGVMDENFNIIIPAIYDFVSGETKDKFVISTNGKRGLISSQGKIILEPLYDHISLSKLPIFIEVSQNKKTALFSEEGKAITPFKYDNLLSQIDDKSGNDPLFPNGAYFATVNGKEGMIDKDLNELIPFKYQGLYKLSNGLFKFKHNNKYGVMKLNGDVVIQPQFDEVTNLNDDYYKIELNEKSGVFDLKTNKIVTDVKFDSNISLNTDNNGNVIGFNVSWHGMGFSIKSDGSYPESYFARQQDNKTLFNFELPPKVEISETVSAQGKADYQKFDQYMTQATTLFREKEQEMEELPDADYLVKLNELNDYKKGEGERIAALALTDPEIVYLANLYLNRNYIEVQNNVILIKNSNELIQVNKPLFDEIEEKDYSNSKELYRSLMSTLRQRMFSLNRLGDALLDGVENYEKPENIATAEMIDFYKKLEQKYTNQ